MLNEKPFRDGIITSRGTFQKLFDHHELRSLIEDSLGVSSVAAAPGVFLVFREPADLEQFLANRHRRRASAPGFSVSETLFASHREILQRLIDFVVNQGRLPRAEETTEFREAVDNFGSVKHASSVVRRVTEKKRWLEIRRDRTQDLLVYLALSAFSGRPRFSDLSVTLRYDIKALLGSYKAGREQANELLFAPSDQLALAATCNTASVGKRTREALYVHVSAVDSLPPILRVYEGCGRVLAGSVEDANIVKMHALKPQISYLAYPSFDKCPHPTLDSVLKASLADQRVSYRDFREWDSPPLLHRKELFVSEDYPRYGTFARLTKQEESWGLLDEPTRIGTLSNWQRTLADKHAAFKGHRLVRDR